MRIVFSNIVNVNPYTKVDNHLNVEMAKLSNFLAQQQGFKTTFFGDKKSIEIFNNVKYDEVNELNDDRIKNISPSLWSIGKLLTISKIKEPFLHLDHDLFLFKKIDETFLNKNLVYFHNEDYYDSLMDNFQTSFEFQLLNIQNIQNTSKNCAIIGGQNYKILNTVCNEILDFIFQNKNEINLKLNSDKILNYPKFMPAVLIEQVWIFKLLNYYKEEFSPLLKEKSLHDLSLEAYTNNICHLQETKNTINIQKSIRKMNKYYNL